MGMLLGSGAQSRPPDLQAGSDAPMRTQTPASSRTLSTVSREPWSGEVSAAVPSGRRENAACGPRREGAGGFHTRAWKWGGEVAASCYCVVPSGLVFCCRGWVQRDHSWAKGFWKAGGHQAWGWVPALGTPSSLQRLLWKTFISVGAAGLACR